MSAEKHHFLPPSNAAKTRQKVWSFLQKSTDSHLLQDLATVIGEDYPATYAAARHLVRKGLAERVNVPTPSPTKRNKDRIVQRMALKGIAPWAPSKKSSWV